MEAFAKIMHRGRSQCFISVMHDSTSKLLKFYHMLRDTLLVLGNTLSLHCCAIVIQAHKSLESGWKEAANLILTLGLPQRHELQKYSFQQHHSLRALRLIFDLQIRQFIGAKYTPVTGEIF